jgi:hypothetical protein
MKKAAARPVPTACAAYTSMLGWCGRVHEPTEYMFRDPEYAVAHYAEDARLRLCPVCVERIIGARPR